MLKKWINLIFMKITSDRNAIKRKKTTLIHRILEEKVNMISPIPRNLLIINQVKNIKSLKNDHMFSKCLFSLIIFCKFKQIIKAKK